MTQFPKPKFRAVLNRPSATETAAVLRASRPGGGADVAAGDLIVTRPMEYSRTKGKMVVKLNSGASLFRVTAAVPGAIPLLDVEYVRSVGRLEFRAGTALDPAPPERTG